MNLELFLKVYENREMEEFFHFINKNAYNFYGDYVTEMLEGVVGNLKITSPTYIIAPTGCGKNCFIEWFVKNQFKERFLLLSNRVALNRQLKIRMIKNLGEDHFLQELTDEGIDKLETIKNVTIKTYHKFYLDALKKDELNMFDFVICDEVHFLDADSTFVPYTGEILKKITSMRNARRIYMTATPNYIFNTILIEEEKKFKNSLNYVIGQVNQINAFNPTCYELKKDTGLVEDVKFFQQFDCILKKIEKSDEKWLIFIDSIYKGETICQMLSKMGKNSALITADTKNKKEGIEYIEYEKILKKEFFDADIVIATKTMECGISIKIKNLKNIVINDIDFTSFMQKIGRKRKLAPNDKIKLFVKIPSLNEINKKLYDCGEQMRKMYVIEKMDKISMEQFINSGDFYLNKNICFIKDGQLQTNELAWIKLKRDQQFYEMLKDSINCNPLNPAILVLHWLYPNKKEIIFNQYDLVIDLQESEDNKKKIQDFLDEYIDKTLKGTDIDVFKEKFKTLYLTYFKNENERKISRSFGKNIISKIMRELELPYRIYGNAKQWSIFKED